MDKIKITTPEHIELEYELAGLGSRFVAVVVDHVIQFFIMGLFILIGVIAYFPFFEGDTEEIFSSLFIAVILLLMFVISTGYFIFFEAIWSGQTPGKKLAQIQVVKENGEPVGFMESLLRNLFRFIDMLPFYYYLGIAFIWFHKQKKRVGDIVARTIVVKQKSNLRPVVLPELKIRSDLQVNVAPLSEQEYAMIRDFLIARYRLKHEVRTRLATKLGLIVEKKLNLQNVNVDTEELLEVIAVEYRNFKKSI